MKKILLFILILLLTPFNFLSGAANSGLAGRILLQVEEHGEAWYVCPETLIRHFLGRPFDAWQIMREQGIGITDNNLDKIPVGIISVGQSDKDDDGLSDALEAALGTDPTDGDTDGDSHSDQSELIVNSDPLSGKQLPISDSFTKDQAGRIFLQVEAHGEAWYVSPTDNRRYYLGRPEAASWIMKKFGLGISNYDLENLTVEETLKPETDRLVKKQVVTYAPNLNLRLIEKLIQEIINQKRSSLGLNSLEWNDDLANVAREHSLNLANENENYTGIGVTCDFPLIHHEGVTFGPYHRDRLEKRGVYYFGKSGENIALMSAADVMVRFKEDDPRQFSVNDCGFRRDNLDENYQNKLAEASPGEERMAVVEDEITVRTRVFMGEQELAAEKIEWYSEKQIAENTVDGWLLSAGHKKNIVDDTFNESGVGAAHINGYVVVTQSFIKRESCGYLNGPCCEEEDHFPYCFVPYECTINKCSR